MVSLLIKSQLQYKTYFFLGIKKILEQELECKVDYFASF
jgi:hypothetical protein